METLDFLLFLVELTYSLNYIAQKKDFKINFLNKEIIYSYEL